MRLRYGRQFCALLVLSSMTGLVLSAAAASPKEESPPRPERTINRLDLKILQEIASTDAVLADLKHEFEQQKQAEPLEEEECRRLAAEASTSATLLEMELSIVLSQKLPSANRALQAACARRRLETALISNAAVNARRRTVAQALEAFVALATAQARLETLWNTVAELDAAVAESARLDRLGIPSEMKPDKLRADREHVLAQGVALYEEVDKRNAQLAYLLGRDDSPGSFRPRLSWHIHPITIDVEATVALGLQNNEELRVLDELARRLDAATLETIESFLPGLQPLLSIASAGGRGKLGLLLSFLCPPKPDGSRIEARRAQLRFYRDRRRQELASEIRDAAATLVTSQQRLSFERERWKLLRDECDDATQKHGEGVLPLLAVTNAKIELRRQEDAVISAIAQWHGARVKLGDVTGTLWPPGQEMVLVTEPEDALKQ
ncbi:Outer membrane efflux protein [Planctomycetes bacterium Pan216]|uniref:Outer membrane efflux protein n=1 Tax=Kolteria novifilia TaxID=2527975 RepID=A0A518B4D4_9BACT|nr:Outer membrane efflux protein [Planctomycetes bacterium Pan216]